MDTAASTYTQFYGEYKAQEFAMFSIYKNVRLVVLVLFVSQNNDIYRGDILIIDLVPVVLDSRDTPPTPDSLPSLVPFDILTLCLYCHSKQ